MSPRAYSVPDLEFDHFVFDMNSAGAKLHTNSEIVLLSEASICEL